jgi:hypothetical protein
LGMSNTSVHRIMNDKRPCKSNRPKERANILDDFDHCVNKRTIHGLYYLHAKQSNVCLYPRIFLGHQTHHSEATYNLCSVRDKHDIFSFLCSVRDKHYILHRTEN